MTMYCIAGLSMMHMLLHVESECDIHVITRGRMWRNNKMFLTFSSRFYEGSMIFSVFQYCTYQKQYFKIRA